MNIELTNISLAILYIAIYNHKLLE